MGFDGDRLDGRDPRVVARLQPLFEAVARRYFRLESEGTEHLPAAGRPAIFVANHNGGIAGPDLVCTLATLWGTLGPGAPLYAMAHDFAMRQLKPLGRLLQLVGAVRASQENARRVLESGGQLLVYPGGDLDAYRAFWRRDEVIFGERHGFVRLAQQLRVPIVPIVAQGAHRSALILSDGARLANAVGLPRWGRLQRFPIALALPYGLTLGPWLPYLPLPWRVRLAIGAPVSVGENDDPARARDAIRAQMQAMMDRLAARGRR